MNKSEKFDGMMYFAQRLQEAVFYYTIDIYKAPLLNTNQLAREYITVFENMQNDPSNKSNLKSHLEEILKEFLYSFERDVVLKEYWGEENITLIKNKIGSQNSNAIAKTMHYLRSIWDNCVYYNWCSEYTKEVIKNPIEKKKIENAVRCILPEFYAYGYSNEYIYKNTKKYLFDKKPKSFDAFDEFLSAFSLKKTNYKVYLAINKEILEFKDLLQENLGLCFDDDGNFKRLKHNDNYVVVSFDEITTRDEYRAIKIAKHRLDIFLLFYIALDNKKNIDIFETAMVSYNDDFEFLPSKESIMKSIEKYDSTEAGELAIEKLFSITSHEDEIVVLLSKIFEKHNISLSDSSVENSFLNLWSILEIFSASIEGGSKIEKVRKSVLKIISNNYYKRILIDICKNLKLVLKQDKFEEFISKVVEDGDEYHKVACLIFLDSYKDVREDLNSALKKSPKLRSRIAQLNDLGGNVKRMHSQLSRYIERVSWHLARMYRCRNSIIHSGETNDLINLLIVHLHSYVDILIDDLVDNLTGKIGLDNIDDIILYNQIREEKIEKLLGKDESISNETLLMLLK